MKPENTVLGIELGSTRIKAVLLDERHLPVAQGSYSWENQLVNGVWTYPMADIHNGIRMCYADLKKNIMEKYRMKLTRVGAIGISAMMHGYLPLDEHWKPIAEFRTWRNTVTAQASEQLTDLFRFHIPQRWSIAHFYQAILNREEHLPRLAHLTTLAGYLHHLLTGENCIGIGDASGMFPVDGNVMDYHPTMIRQFDELLLSHGYHQKIKTLLPRILLAGEEAGVLTKEGANFLDPEGDLLSGIPFAPCEGDAGTGIVSTNSVRTGTGSVSAGTSVFAMVVLKRSVSARREIDMVMTPGGLPAAMIHCNNCTSDLNAWVRLFSEILKLFGTETDQTTLYRKLFSKAIEGDFDCGGLLTCNYLSGEHLTDIRNGRPFFIRTPESRFNLANLMRAHLYSALATLKMGLNKLMKEENISIERLCAQGGFFQIPNVGDRFLSAATGIPVTIMETAGEGGAYGMAVLTAFRLWGKKNESLEEYLDRNVFDRIRCTSVLADTEEISGFAKFFERYGNMLPLERLAEKSI